MLKFKEVNLNPKGKKTCDCAIRAITGATGLPYYVVYQDLYSISVETGYMLNEKRCLEKLIAKYGFVKMKQPKKANGTKYLVNELDLICDTTNKSVLVKLAGHLTWVKDNTIRDLWNCGYKTIGNYYVKVGK